MNKFKKLYSMQKAKRVIDVGTELLSSAYEVSKDPRTSNILLGIGKVMQKGIEAYSGKINSSDIVRDWELLPGLSTGIIPHIRIATAMQNSQVMSEDNYVAISELYGMAVAFMDGHIYTEKKENIEKLMEYMGRLLQETWGPRCRVFKEENYSHRSTSYGLEPFDPPLILGSEKQTDIMRRIDKFKTVGEHRSILLYGPPGTGKTSIANGVAAHVKGTCIVMDASILFDSGDISVIKMMRPDTLVVHDIDHLLLGSQSNALSAMEEIYKIVPVIVMTANSTDISKAFLRPERFDDLIPINQLGKIVFDSIMGETLALVKPDDVSIKILRQWPAVFLSDLAKRIKALGPEAFDAEFEDLKSRIDINNRDDSYLARDISKDVCMTSPR